MKLCECGCGEPAPLAPYTNRTRGYVKDEPMRFVHGHHRRKSGVAFVEEDRGYLTPCWIWQRTKTRGGYGMTHDGVRSLPAHKAAWERENGPVPEGLTLDHLCRTRDCVRPAHLEPITNALNCQRGLMAKLDWTQVREIRASSLSRRELAERYGVSYDTIGLIVRGKTWREAPSEREDRSVAGHVKPGGSEGR